MPGIRTRTRGPSRGTRYPITSRASRFGSLEPGEIQVVSVGTRGRFGRIEPSIVLPWSVDTTLADGRAFKLQVNAIDRAEVERLVSERFPLVTINKISRVGHPKLETIGRILYALRPPGVGGA